MKIQHILYKPRNIPQYLIRFAVDNLLTLTVVPRAIVVAGLQAGWFLIIKIK